MNIVYLVFGDKMHNYQQVYFSIYTAMSKKSSVDRIIVITENKSLFNSFGDSIEIISIDSTLIKEWEGKHQFFWRVKIKALQLVAQKYPLDSILYLDGDTFIYKNMEFLSVNLSHGQNFMHIEEGKLSKLRSKTEKLMWKGMKNKTYLQTKIDESTAMWNAGVIGVSYKHLECLNYTLDFNDALCEDKITRRLIEQFSFSIGLNKFSPLKAADDIVGHYWGNKTEWNNFIDLFLKECFMKKYSLDQILDRIHEIDLGKYPIWVKESNTQRKLKMFIDRFYQNRRPVFIEK